MSRFAARVAFVGVFTMVALAAACGEDNSADGGEPSSTAPGGGSTPSGSARLSVRGNDYGFAGPAELTAGQVTFRFENEGQESHDLDVMRLDDGVMIHQFAQSLHDEGLDAALDLGQDSGHIATIAPGETAEDVLELEAGEYILICLETSPDDGTSHASKGMFAPLTVMEAP